MLNNIRVYNVGFGDCALLAGTNAEEIYNVVVDCGTRSKEEMLEGAVKSLKDYLDNHRNDKNIGVLTHFHKDHCSGFAHFNPIFDEFYFPNFFSAEEIELQLYLLITQSLRSTNHQFAYQLLKSVNLIGSAIKDGGIARFVQNGRHIIDGIEVLWPRDEVRNRAQNVVERIKEKLKERLGNGADEAKKLIEEIQQSLFALGQYNDNENIYEIRNNRNTREIIQWLEQAEEQLKELNNSPYIIKFDENIKREIRDIQNHYSLVFNKTNEDNRILFLGDVDKISYNTHLAQEVKAVAPYHAVKIAHHGTKPYFTEELPETNKMIISNGDYGKCQISSQYILKYPETEFVCTNRSKCEFFGLTNKSCRKVKEALCRATEEKGLHCGFNDDIYRDIF